MKSSSIKVSLLLGVLSGLGSAHSHAESLDDSKTHVGETQADLDAKWGTDVSALSEMSFEEAF